MKFPSSGDQSWLSKTIKSSLSVKVEADFFPDSIEKTFRKRSTRAIERMFEISISCASIISRLKKNKIEMK